jgi:hypothetical protein
VLVTTAIIIALIKAGTNPATSKAGLSRLLSQIIVELITNTNKPKVTKLSGNVKSVNRSLKLAFANPKIKAAVTTALGFLTIIPGIKFAAMINTSAVISQVAKNFLHTPINLLLSLNLFRILSDNPMQYPEK